MKKINVLVYTSLFPNHMQPNFAIFVKQRMAHFSRLEGCRIRVVAPVPYYPPLPLFDSWHVYSRIKAFERLDGIDVYHPRYPLIPKVSMPFHGLALFAGSLGLVQRIYRDFPFDLIDGHYVYPDGLAAVLLAKKMKKPVILSARGSDINQFSHFKLINPMIRFALKQSDHVISVSNALKKDMVSLGIARNKITVIPNGVDPKLFHPVNKIKARDKLFISNNKKIILSVGGLIPNKGHHFIINTLPSLLLKYPDLHLFIAGNGPYRNEIVKRIDLHKLESHVTLLGEVSNKILKYWYSASDIFCLASEREGWANVIMESLACGTPVVATKVYGAPEIITTPKVGILVDRDRNSIYQGLRQALGTDWDRSYIREHVRNRDWFGTARAVKNVFERYI